MERFMDKTDPNMAGQFYKAVLDYMRSPAFAPETALDPETLKALHILE